VDRSNSRHPHHKDGYRLGLNHGVQVGGSRTESTSLEGRNSCHGRGATGKPARSLVKALCQWLGLWKVGRTAEAEPGDRRGGLALSSPTIRIEE